MDNASGNSRPPRELAAGAAIVAVMTCIAGYSVAETMGWAPSLSAWEWVSVMHSARLW